jgi:hypothetical protein
VKVPADQKKGAIVVEVQFDAGPLGGALVQTESVEIR